jgi:hypothetical protein
MTEATHLLTVDAVRAWLAEYGIDANDAIEARIVIARHGAPHGHDIGAWLCVECYQRDNLGWKAVVNGEPARRGVLVPLHSWPLLTPIE